MSLDWNIQACNPPMIVDANDNTSHYCLCLLMIHAGVDRVTRENFLELYKRVHAYEITLGALRSADGHPRFFTQQEVERWIGLTTNVGRKTRVQFTRDLGKWILKQIDSEMEKTR